MKRSFEVTDRYKGRDVTATLLVDTALNTHDMLLITEAIDEHGCPVPVTRLLTEQFIRCFINEHEDDYNEILLMAETENDFDRGEPE